MDEPLARDGEREKRDNLIIWLCLITLAAAVVWSCFAELARVVRADGQIVTATRTRMCRIWKAGLLSPLIRKRAMRSGQTRN